MVSWPGCPTSNWHTGAIRPNLLRRVGPQRARRGWNRTLGPVRTVRGRNFSRRLEARPVRMPSGPARLRPVPLEPLDAGADAGVDVPPPAVAAVVGRQVDLGPVLRQAGLGLLRHAVRADAVLRRMVEVVGVAV